MSKSHVVVLLAIGLAACNGASYSDSEGDDENGNWESAQVDVPHQSFDVSTRSARRAPAEGATSVRATISGDARDAEGRVVIPAGSTVLVTVAHGTVPELIASASVKAVKAEESRLASRER